LLHIVTTSYQLKINAIIFKIQLKFNTVLYHNIEV